ncbi:hypothetical protein NEICINOT_03902 [Neisseria cinerea ATCC 14685]|uniref:Uncharacterized protein n=1 Tax=Neisseria cinerea ATCC 14685 TaxID=546262 RepID=D0W2L9_NEICI|nr:hypothetical protein NEICINOT_03902 [Neisseria cinerea ATCC 14685]
MPSENQPFQTASVHLTGQNAHSVRKYSKPGKMKIYRKINKNYK